MIRKLCAADQLLAESKTIPKVREGVVVRR